MEKYKGFYCRFVKRFFDILISVLFFVLFGWLYAILAVLVRIFLGAPVIFKQDRPGKIDPKTGEPKIFKLYKFRSMTNAKDETGKLLPDAKRLTKFGKLLRKTSLDEIPEMWNILKGDMSFIGPRPWLVRYIALYTDYEMQRQLIRPGLTGWAQVNGRNASGWEERFKYDVEYVNKVSFALDVKIVFMTVKNVLTHSGIEFEKDHQTMGKYLKEKYSAEANVNGKPEEKPEDTLSQSASRASSEKEG